MNDHTHTTTLLASLNAVATWYRPGGKLHPTEIAQRISDQFFHGAAQPHFQETSQN